MQVLTNEIDKLALPAEWADHESTLTIGSFDGIHTGHRFLIRQLVAEAEIAGRLSGLVTFYPHPATVLHPRRPARHLTTPGEKTALLELLGLDWIAILPFTRRLASMSPRVFVQHLYHQVNMRTLWVGAGFALGQCRRGNIARLRSLADEMGFDIREISPITQDGHRVSSTHIRTLLRRGRVEKAARLLKRYYSISGEVIYGVQRGRCIGFPTANLDVRPDRVLPVDGIYASFAYLGSERRQAVVYIGVQPSFDQGARSIEAHLLDFDRDIYGCDLVIEFVARLRPDRRFPDVKDLIAQIGRDVEQARQILSSAEKEGSESALQIPTKRDIILVDRG